MLITVTNRKPTNMQKYEHPFILLTRDNWNDYGYVTGFNAWLYLEDEVLDLGGLRILHASQEGGPTPMPDAPVEALDTTYCSLGDDLSYYEKLLKCGPKIYSAYLKAMRDVAFDSAIKAEFEDKEGFRVSFLRATGAERTISDASKLIRPPKAQTLRNRGNGFVAKFKTRFGLEANSFMVSFDFRKTSQLPSRLNILIGYNGVGKTALLSQLAIAVSGFGYENKEELLAKSAGSFVGSLPPFKTVVVVSYSAFDTFVIPGRTEIEKKRLKSEGSIFGYVYCGLREVMVDDKQLTPQFRLKTPFELESDFMDALTRVKTAARQDALTSFLLPLLQDASFLRVGLSQLLSNNNKDCYLELFRNLSSGHKIVLKIIVDLAAYMNELQPTLVLIDEPETHLHPPLLAALLKSIRICLEHFDGYAIIATHSPVVVQETPGRFVHVLKRLSTDTVVASATIETFGESVGVITQEVFNLDDGSTDWHDTLRGLAKRMTLAQIEELFCRRLGFGARSYIVSLLSEDVQKE